jgi:hypothetical protein
MGYTFTCDACGSAYDRAPCFMGEFRETFLKTSDSPLTELYQPGQTVTVCRACCEGSLL